MTLRPGNPILFALCVVLIVVTGVGDDMRSCDRSTAVRAANRAYFAGVASRAQQRAGVETGRFRSIDIASYRAARRAVVANRALSCSLPSPDTH